MNDSKMIRFVEDISGHDLPQRFTFPFYYEPHPIALSACRQLQKYLTEQTDFAYNFGLGDDPSGGLGKMFGVLVVKDKRGEIGYLAAYSGKLGEARDLAYFVPPVFDMYHVDGYFVSETEVLRQLNDRLKVMRSAPERQNKRLAAHRIREEVTAKIASVKSDLKRYKQERREAKRKLKNKISEAEYSALYDQHNQESINDNFLLREYTYYLEEIAHPIEKAHAEAEQSIKDAQDEMAAKSVALQDWLFDQYKMLNINGEQRTVKSIFENRIIDVPPSGTGDCAAPKLLQYAFVHGMQPLALAEFWWGRSPASMGRKHGYYYPACRGKCEPVLGHMLLGMDVNPNPLLDNLAYGKVLDTVYEDEHLLVINKPAEFMSVPGKVVIDSVQERMKAKYPEATGPMIVHRLDMSTSGLMIIAKDKDIHKTLQQQFKTRSIEKRYVAVLDGVVPEDEGYINLPLRVDIDNRPYQIVCEEYGKKARTRYEVVSRGEGTTRIHFYPITGRTHQLRVHASHHLGLNTPIVGDDLYGIRGERLLLHAERLTFIHPSTGERVVVQVDAGF